MPQRLSNRRQKEIGKLRQRKHRRRQGRTLVEGVRAVEAALADGAPLVCLVTSEAATAGNARLAALLHAAASAGVDTYATDRETLAALGVASPQGVLAVANAALAPPEELAEARAVLVLDGVQDPGNVGTALRTAAWFGAEAVLAGPGTAGLYGPKTMRAGMGAHWRLTLARTAALADVLGRLRRRDFALYGADVAGTPVRAWRPRRPSALVLGSEAHGLSAAVLEMVEERVALPPAAGHAPTGGVESLNVAVAGGILVYEWLGS